MTPPPEQKAASDDQHAAHRVAVIGAGITGLTCARALETKGCTVTVFDRGRRPGGRISTRRMEIDDSTACFDLGAPSFERPTGAFGIEVDRWIESGTVSSWTPTEARWRAGILEEVSKTRPRIIGLPSMDAIPAQLAEGLALESSTTVGGLARLDGSWTLQVTPWREDEREAGPFDSMVLAMAVPQSARLLAGPAPDLARLLEPVRMSTTWVALLEIDDDGTGLPEILHAPETPILEKLIRESGKPGRAATPGRTRWIIHAEDTWSAEQFDTERADIATTLEEQACELLGTITGRLIRVTARTVAHRWGLARSNETLEDPCLCDRELRLAVCGDGIGGSDIEACHLSGLAAADCVGSWSRPTE